MTENTKPAGHGSTAVDDAAEHGLEIKARSQAELVRRRFFRHRAAMAAMLVLVATLLLAFTSIGFSLPGGIQVPGWWKHTYYSPAPMGPNQGAPTLDLIPWFDGDGVSLGEHPFGQDNVGKDYFALTMRGAQRSIVIAFLVGLVSTMLGTLVGALSGYFRGPTESGLMRLTDVMIAIPTLVIAAVVGRSFGGAGAITLAIVLGLITWMGLARIVRGEFLSLREKEFVEAARALGAGPIRIIFKHILPNTIGVIIVSATLATASAILLETALSYLGFGVRPPDTSLGKLVSDYQSAFLTRPWLFWWPGLFIITIALCVNFIGDGLRDAYDPRQQRVRS